MSSSGDATPFAGLGPDTVLDAVESVGIRCDGRSLALNSFENRVYQVGVEAGTPVVAKFYRPGRWTDEAIGEEHQFSLQLAGHEIPVVAPMQLGGATLHRHADYRFAVFPRQGGRSPELQSEADREQMGRFIGRIHAVGRAGAFEHRPQIELERLGEQPRRFLLDSRWVPEHLIASYDSVTAHLLDAVDDAFEVAADCRVQRIHGDCHLGNVLWTDDGPHFVDLDDCVTGPAVQDLWMLLSGEREEMTRQLTHVAAGYEEFCELDRRELWLIEPLRTLRMIYYTAWVARRWQDPAFPLAFPWLTEVQFWEEHVLALKEQLAALQEGPLQLG